jgi:phosphate transport system protein
LVKSEQFGDGYLLRKSFHEELKDIKADLLRMGSVTRNAIENAIKVMVECDLELADEVIAMDDTIDRMNYEIEEHCMEVIARQAPVARDLRLCWSIMFIALHLERMGDLAVNMAKGAKRLRMDDEQVPSVARYISDMGEQTLILDDACLQAVDEKNLELADKLSTLDDKVDAMHKKIFTELSVYQKQESVEWLGNILLASRYLERIADHCVDIAERVTYLVTGQIPDAPQWFE